MGLPQKRWMMSWKIPSFEMDDDRGYPDFRKPPEFSKFSGTNDILVDLGLNSGGFAVEIYRCYRMFPWFLPANHRGMSFNVLLSAVLDGLNSHLAHGSYSTNLEMGTSIGDILLENSKFDPSHPWYSHISYIYH